MEAEEFTGGAGTLSLSDLPTGERFYTFSPNLLPHKLQQNQENPAKILQSRPEI
jgi:hypothetical protein